MALTTDILADCNEFLGLLQITDEPSMNMALQDARLRDYEKKHGPSAVNILKPPKDLSMEHQCPVQRAFQ